MNKGYLIGIGMLLVCLTVAAGGNKSFPEAACMELNQLQGAESLRGFFGKLNALETGESDRVRIIHIGDSHIQADFMTARMRHGLHQRFGNGGRGLVFPYKLARTHGPFDLFSVQDGKWNYRRNVFPNRQDPTGICGYSVSTSDSKAWFCLQLEDVNGKPQAFDRADVFYSIKPGRHAMDVLVSDSLPDLEPVKRKGVRMKHLVSKGEYLGLLALQYKVESDAIVALNRLNDGLIHPGQVLKIPHIPEQVDLFNMPDLQTTVRLESVRVADGYAVAEASLEAASDHLIFRPAEQGFTDFRLYGIYLENSRSPGVVYSAVGVNGARADHFMDADHFIPQLSDLPADLVILSLGTNEALDGSFDSATAVSRYELLLNEIRMAQPFAAILLTTPPDHQIEPGKDNRNALQMQQGILELAHRHKLAVWDLYEMMGGYGSLRGWKSKGLAQADMIHFNREGYELTGDALLEALLKAYGDFLAR